MKSQQTKPHELSTLPPSIFFIPFHVPSSKNSRIVTRHGAVIASKATQKYRKFSKLFWESDKDNFRKLSKTYPILVGFHFIRKTRHKYDWVNPLQTVLDEMTRHGWIDDDNIEIILPIPLKWKGNYSTVDKDLQGVLIKLL